MCRRTSDVDFIPPSLSLSLRYEELISNFDLLEDIEKESISSF